VAEAVPIDTDEKVKTVVLSVESTKELYDIVTGLPALANHCDPNMVIS
jgi:hypothetical protein